MPPPNALILRAPGTNCDHELQFAFERAGAKADLVHINRLRESPRVLQRYQILAIPGGFSYGDDVAAGKLLALQLSRFLGDPLRKFRDQEKLILGICNGFQALLKAGLLVSEDEDGPLATLAANTSGRFTDRWVPLQAVPGDCPFLKDLNTLELPIAHGEGNFRGRAAWIARGLEQAGQVVLRYLVNPNGSENDIAGLCDPTGRVLGLMPHPERHVLPTQHPNWSRRPTQPSHGDGFAIFHNAVRFFG